MRPNADIPYSLNGRAKDLATHFNENTQAIYRRIIERGISELEYEAFGNGESVDWDAVGEECGFDEEELAAAQAVVSFTRARGGTVLKEDVLEEVKPEHTARKNSDDNWWRSIVNPLEESGVVEKFHSGGIQLR